MRTKENYIALLKSLEQHKELLEDDTELPQLSNIKNKIFTRELIEDYGWDLPYYVTGNCRWFRLTDEIGAGVYGTKHGRVISWEDDGNQPEDEFLLCVSYPTGAYFFGKDYDTKLFDEFFQELTTFKPKYRDSENHSMYFTKEVAGRFLDEYGDITQKYRDRYNSEAKKRKMEKLREELAKLEDE